MSNGFFDLVMNGEWILNVKEYGIGLGEWFVRRVLQGRNNV
jgi:hypothetical protein